MKHARPDYNRIQDPAGRIPEDEPVFLIRAQDKVSGDAVRAWADLAQAAGAEHRILEAARAHAGKMDVWATKQVPDMAPKITVLGFDDEPRPNVRTFKVRGVVYEAAAQISANLLEVYRPLDYQYRVVDRRNSGPFGLTFDELVLQAFGREANPSEAMWMLRNVVDP